MTRRNLRINIFIVTIIYAIIIAIGTLIYFDKPDDHNKYFTVFKDLILLWVAIPAAYLGDCFQRRSAFTAALREMWANMIESVNQARQFTFDPNQTQETYGEVLKSLSKSIDEVRGVYSNIGETKNKIGLYPYESLKEIQKLISQLGYGKYDQLKSDKTRCSIEHHWGLIKSSFLFEFDRPVPTVVNTPYQPASKHNHWETANCVEIRKDNGKVYFQHNPNIQSNTKNQNID